jgi:hypothetical protein
MKKAELRMAGGAFLSISVGRSRHNRRMYGGPSVAASWGRQKPIFIHQGAAPSRMDG